MVRVTSLLMTVCCDNIDRERFGNRNALWQYIAPTTLLYRDAETWTAHTNHSPANLKEVIYRFFLSSNKGCSLTSLICCCFGSPVPSTGSTTVPNSLTRVRSVG